MKISIITVVFNGTETIEDCLKSVIKQTYPHIEHIIIDGGSTDGTLAIIEKNRDKVLKIISESDNGIYDAMNKGIRLATGNIVAILNSDDMYADEFVVENVLQAMSDGKVDTCYGDLVYVDREDIKKVIRNWKGGEFNKLNFKKGWMPPHPTFFVKREIYEKYGLFNLGFPIAADYEIMLRFLYRYNVSTAYVPKVLVKMRTGGKSRPDVLRIARNMLENYQAWRANGLRVNPFTFILKPLLKVTQYIGQK